MSTLVVDVVKFKIQKDINSAINSLGLYVEDVTIDMDTNMAVRIHIKQKENLKAAL